EMKYLNSKIANMEQFKPYRSDTNFFLIKLAQINSLALRQKLLKKNILVRDCSTFTGMGTDFIRVAVQKRRANNLLVNGLKEIQVG
ncbi:MAG: aminotransferase class I/II, partial [Nitrososphaerales archaeon]